MMPLVPTTLVRITRFYLLTALVYLIATLGLAVAQAAGGHFLPPIDSNLFWYAGVLGWVSLPVMGAFYQFFPTLQGRDLRMERWTFPQYGLVNLGLVGMLASLFAGSQAGLGIFTAVYGLGAFLLAVILLGSNLNPSKITLTLRFFITAIVYFLAGTTILALNNLGITALGRPVVSHLVLIGWAIMAIYGAQYIMVPMLQLKNLAWEGLADFQYYVANLGIIGLAWGFLGGGTLVVAIGGTIEFLAIVLFLAVILRSVTTGPSRLAKLDLSVMFYLAGDAYLVLVPLMGIAITVFPDLIGLRPVHMTLAIIGIVTNIIVGAMYHILPFLVWWENYAGKVGAERVPLLKELFHEPFARFSFYVWNGALWGMVAGLASGMYALVVAFGTLELVLAVFLLAQMLHLVARHTGKDAAPSKPHSTTQNQPASGGI